MTLKADYETLSKSLSNENISDEDLKSYLGAAYRLLVDALGTYIDMDEDDKLILAAWMLAAPAKEAFKSFPLLYLNASKGSGKTRLVNFIAAVIPDSEVLYSPTEATLYRSAASQKCLLFDEAERSKISNSKGVDLTALLNKCYKKGGSVPRYETRYDKEVKGNVYVKVSYLVYVPVVLANTFGLAGIIEDRCITIVLKKSKKNAIINTPEYYENDPIISLIRAFILKVSEGVGVWLGGIYMEPLAQFYIYNKYTYIHTHPPLTTTNKDVETFRCLREGVNVDGRQKELWTPIWLITFTFDMELSQRLISIAQDRISGHMEESAEFDRDTSAAILLWRFLQTLEFNEMYPKQFRDWYMDHEAIPPAEARKHWLSSEWIGHFVRRAKILEKKPKKTNKGFLYSINKAKLRDYLETRDALPDEDAEPVKPKQGQAQINSPEKGQSSGDTEKRLDLPPSLPVSSSAKQNSPYETTQEILAFLRGSKEGLLLGHGFEAAPEQWRHALRNMAIAGEIYEPKEGIWVLNGKGADEA